MTDEQRIRAELLEALLAYVRGETDSDVLDDRIYAALEMPGWTPELHGVWQDIWCLYDDFKPGLYEAGVLNWIVCRRYIALLRSDLPAWLPQPRPWWKFWLQEKPPSSWPFRTRADWLKARRLVSDLPTPGRAAQIGPRDFAKLRRWVSRPCSSD